MSELQGVYRTGTVGQPVLVLLHSSQSNSGQWRALTSALKHEFDIIAVDLLGYGSAPAVATNVNRDDFRLGHETPRVTAALEYFNITTPVTLIGHSYGGAVALKLAVDKLVQVKRLVVFEPVAFHVLKQQDPARQEIERIAAILHDHDAETGTRAFVDYWNQPGFFDGLPERVQNSLVAQAPKVVMDFSALMGEPTPLEAYGHIDCPVLLLQGKYTQASAQQVAANLLTEFSQAASKTLACGHMGPLTNPEVVNPEIQSFLQPLLTVASCTDA